MALKHAGHGHEQGGIDATSNGELMAECPACPHPGKNLPNNWEKAGPLLYAYFHSFVLQLIFLRFLYTLYIAVDANFKLKGKQHHLDDVKLMPGWCAYAPKTPYQSHIANNVKQPEVRAQYICQSKITSHHIPTDQYLWIPTWHTSPCSKLFVTWICSFKCDCGDLFETLYDTEEWCWQSSKG